MAKTFSLEEVQKHKQPDDLWLVLHNRVYNVTTYLQDHPGGDAILKEVAGTDATEGFEEVGHSMEANDALQDLYLGDLAEEHRAVAVEVFRPTFQKVSQQAAVKVPRKTTRTPIRILRGALGLGLAAGAGAIIFTKRGDTIFATLRTTLARLPISTSLSASSKGSFWSGFCIATAAEASLSVFVSMWIWSKFDVQEEFTHFAARHPANSKRTIPARGKPALTQASAALRSGKPVQSASAVLNPKEYRPFKLIRKTLVSPNVYRFVFALPHSQDVLGLPTGQHVALRATIDGKSISRSYTPVSNNSDLGRIELLIKVYDQGAMTQYLASMSVGQTIDIRGPKGAMQYSRKYATKIGMIAGGTGITPMYQLIRAICEDDSDNTQISLIYANNTEEDILLRDELQGFAVQCPHKFRLHYVLSKPPAGWTGSSGFVTGDLIKKHLPAAEEATKMLLCGPPPMISAMATQQHTSHQHTNTHQITHPNTHQPHQHATMTWTRPTTTTRPIAILGAGVLGRRIATVFVAGGYNVHIRDPSPSARSDALAFIAANAAHFASELNPTKSIPPGSYSAYEDIASAVKNAWLVIEAVPEKLDLKVEIFEELDRKAPRDCILGSNSSSFRSGLMVGRVGEERRGVVCNVHFTMPPGIRTVELMTDGETEEGVLEFLRGVLEGCGMVVAVARRESTGFIFNRLWAAVKREILTILAEGVSDAAEIDRLWQHMFRAEVLPCQLMDQVGLDTVAFIEDNYISERGLSGSLTVDWLRKNYISRGKLGNKSTLGGLYPPDSHQTLTPKRKPDPTLFILDVGLGSNAPSLSSVHTNGKILRLSPGTSRPVPLVTGLPAPDGIAISKSLSRIFFTNMGPDPSKPNGSLMSCRLDGSDLKTLIPPNTTIFTPKQLVFVEDSQTLYFCDREGMSIHRIHASGSNHEILLQRTPNPTKTTTPNPNTPNPINPTNQTSWCVGLAIDHPHKKIYWSQKGPSKSNTGRIFRAGLQIPPGESPSTRTDIETLFSHLPEPIDLELDGAGGTLYWTDRGEHPRGSSLNRGLVGGGRVGKVEIVARHFREPIGLALDEQGGRAYVTDLGGAVWRVDLQTGKKEIVFEDEGCYTGICLG
ncbi:YWTD domain-containing protein [Podospora aff. communis PSN243]|uniref:NADH-cytochrome b5 reductase 1 n=1 Tax=Podospora aff. communis PSN243 TaxID=3040156 RepID=A0AAV9GHE1_9PEZI|nr:YWTD domain-containing protein [Podospora aff. communis PSN243]